MDKLKMRNTVHRLVEMLIAGDYDGLERASRGRRLTGEHLRQAVGEYGRELRMPPEVVFDDLDLNEIEGAIPQAWWVLVDLWTVDEGRSDLTLEIRLTDTGGELYDIEKYNSARATRGVQFMLPVEDSLWVAQEMGRRFGLPRWQFTLSATTANIEAIRLARFATGRGVIIMFEGHYHGHDEEWPFEREKGEVRAEYHGVSTRRTRPSAVRVA